MERPKISFPERSTPGSTPPPRRRSIMPNMARLQMVEACQSSSLDEKSPEPDIIPTTTLPRQRKKLFNETHSRYTTYLDKSLHRCLLELRENGHIESVTAVINSALREHIKKHYGISIES